MTRCPKCGAEIRYIPCRPSQSPSGTLIVGAEAVEVIINNSFRNGRIVQGYLRHECAKDNEACATGGT